MAKLHIQQSMLMLQQLRDLPTSHRAIRVFEWVLEQKNLLNTSTTGEEWLSMPNIAEFRGPSNSELEEGEQTCLIEPTVSSPGTLIECDQWFKEFLGFDFLDNMELPG